MHCRDVLVATMFSLMGSLSVVASESGLVAWWDFEGLEESSVPDRAGQINDTIEGTFTSVAGVTGAAVRLDGFSACLVRKAALAPKLERGVTIQAWVALGAYPWNWCAVVSQKKGQERGYYFAVGPRGEVSFQLAIDGRWHVCTSEDMVIPLRQWKHIAATYNGAELAVYVSGEKKASVEVSGAPSYAREVDLRIGANHEASKPSHIHREHGTLPGWFSLDGILDEIKIHQRAMTASELSAVVKDSSPSSGPALPLRLMPSGPSGPGRFGAYYTKLSYYPEWDALWRVGSDPDVLVRFDLSAARVVFWRGSRYSPAWVSANGLWMADQSVEAWGVGKNDREGCFEHMQDRRCRYSHVRVIESNPARAVVHWRYAPVSSRDHLWKVEPRTGRACWVDEYYTIYPDVMGIRKVSWKTGTLGRPRQFQESLPFTQPGQLQGDVIHEDWATVANLAGERQVLSFVKNPEESKKTFPDDLTIQLYNFKSKARPFIIFEPGNRMAYLKDRRLGSRGLRVPGACNHWPVGQAACDGRTVQAADRPTHFLGFPISRPPVHQKEDRSWWNGLYGMTTGSIDDLVGVARSWARPPELVLEGQGFSSQGYDRGQRAYRLTCVAGAAVLECRLAASGASPVHNPVLVVENWGPDTARLEVNGRVVNRGRDYRVGHRHMVESSKMIVWINLASTKPVQLKLSRLVD